MNGPRRRYAGILKLIGPAGLGFLPGCTTPELSANALAEGLSSALSNLVEAGILTLLF
jgi:hypothetical protein